MNRRFYVLTLSIAVLITLASCAAKDPEGTGSLMTAPSSITEPSDPPDPTKDNGVVAGAPDVSDEDPDVDESQPELETEATDPTEDATIPTEDVDRDPSETSTEPTGGTTSYLEYMNMTADQQESFISSFESMDAFMVWFNNAKAEYDSTGGAIDVGSGSVDLGTVPGGNS